jgi:GT2 family glycosyltransferase
MLQPLAVAMTRDTLGDPPSLDERFRSAYGVLLDLARCVRRSGGRLVVAADAFVARRGGLLSPITEASSDPDDVSADLARLRAESEPGDERFGTAGPWDAAWTCLISTGEPERASLSVIIPVCNQLAYTVQCLESLRAGSVRDFEIVVFDNGSTDGTAEYLRSRGDVRVIRSDQNLGFAPAVNAALAAASGRLLLVLNNDVVVPKRMIERLLEVATTHPECGMLGAVSSWSAPSQLVPAGYRDLRDLDPFADARWERYGPQVRPEAILLGFCLLIRREVLDTIGVFDEGFEIGNFEDGDLSVRATLAGFRLGVADGVYLHHYGSMTFRGENLDYQGLTTRNHARFLAKWGGSERGSGGSAGAIEAATTGAQKPETTPAHRRPLERQDLLPEPPGREPEPPGRDAELAGAAVGSAQAAGPTVDPEPKRATDWIPLDAGLGNGDATVEAPRSVPATGRREEVFDLASVPAGDLYLLADHELGKGNYENAAELFRWAIERMPEMVLAHMGLGIALARAGSANEAIDALERCIELQPDLSEAHNNLGIAYHLAGRDADARAALRRAVELDPENADARANLDEVEARAGRPSRLGAFAGGS